MNLEIQLTAGLLSICTTTLAISQLTLATPATATAVAHDLETTEVLVETTRSPRSPIALRFGWRPPLLAEVPVEYANVTPAPRNAIVDIAICLDTSGSMDGLLESAKQKLWTVVNEFIFADPMPTVRVALYTYGNDGHSEENGWVKLEVGLTEDLDLVSERLFAQSTNGGTELVGRVVNTASGQLAWSEAPDALKLIIVAGNETADQDQVVSFRDACSGAIARDIMVNSFYCGLPGDADAESWRQVARLADGQFAAIDQGLGTLAIATPFDTQLATLSTGLNGTYLAYGTQGAWNVSNQVRQDSNAAGLNSEAAASRAFCKANPIYNCQSWDLVDACRLNTIVLADVKEEDLPEEMRVMTIEQRTEHIAKLQKQRDVIQAEINGIATQRETFLQAEQVRVFGDAALSLDTALKHSIRSQAEAKGYRFPQAPALPATTPSAGIAPAAGATNAVPAVQQSGLPVIGSNLLPQTTNGLPQQSGQQLRAPFVINSVPQLELTEEQLELLQNPATPAPQVEQQAPQSGQVGQIQPAPAVTPPVEEAEFKEAPLAPEGC